MRTTFFLLISVSFLLAGVADDERFTEDLLKPMAWRNIGPINMGGRITDLAVYEARPQVYYVGAASGGVWKTENAGTTWSSVFDRYGTSSIGDIAIDQNNPDLVWVGTGEANLRNSVTPGDGVYKSTDGGKSFDHMGLRQTNHISRVRIHPGDPDVVYVAAVGHAWAPNPERGVYKTTDAGETWDKVLFIDEKTAIIDLAMDPDDPDTLYAAAWGVQRDAFSGSGSPSTWTKGGGIYKTTDGGENWDRLTEGLPTVPTGRIGLDIYRKNTNVVYAVIATKRTASSSRTPRGNGAYVGINAEDTEEGVELTRVSEGGPAAKSGLEVGDMILEFGGVKVESFRDLITEIRKKKPGDKVKVKLKRAGKVVTLTLTLGKRPEREEWEEEEDQEISFQDESNKTNRGGVFRSDDKGRTWKQTSTLNPRPFYYSQIRIDPTNDKNIYMLGVQMHASSNGGERFRNNAARKVHVDHHALWVNPKDPSHLILGNDGGLHVSYDQTKTWEHLNNIPIAQFYAIGLDNRKPYWVYGGLQDNGCWGGPTMSRNGAITGEDWRYLNGGDGFYCRIDPEDPDTIFCESQHGGLVRLNMKTGQRRGIRPRQRGLRFEWNTPLEHSPLDPKRIYVGSQFVHESNDRGNSWKNISRELPKTKQGSISVIGPSPHDENILWVGTNDGGVYLTLDRGDMWLDIGRSIRGLPKGAWCTRIVPSKTNAATAFATFSGHRVDNLEPWVFLTTNYGKTWKKITNGLDDREWVHVLREHPDNPELLFLGTEKTVYASLDRGDNWVKLGTGLPTVPVHDLQIQARDHELVAGTHGRAIWVVDISPIVNMSRRVLNSTFHLFEPKGAVNWLPGKGNWFGGFKGFKGDNPYTGARLWYYLKEDAEDVSIEIYDGDGKRVTRVRTQSKAGLHKAGWSLRRGRSRAATGTYTVKMTVEGETVERTLEVRPDPTLQTEER